MCIRDSGRHERLLNRRHDLAVGVDHLDDLDDVVLDVAQVCLLYTSDAADERSSVDLGGRRIIKKKTLAYTQRAIDRLNLTRSITTMC